MTDKLTLDDADGLEDFADRNERAAATALSVASANSPELAQELVALAGLASQAAVAARRISRMIKEANP